MMRERRATSDPTSPPRLSADKQTGGLRRAGQRQTTVKAAVALVWILLSAAVSYGTTAAEYYAAGYEAFNGGNNAQAVQYLDAALKLDPNNANAYYLLGNAHYKLGDTAAAIAAFQQHLRLNPGNTQVQAFLSQLQARSPTTGSRAKGSSGKWGGAPPKRPPGTVVVFEDGYPFGVKEYPYASSTTVEVWKQEAAFGNACLRYKGDVKQRYIGSNIDWLKAWQHSGVKHPGDLSFFRAKGALVFWVRGKNGGEYFTLLLMMPPEKDYGWDYASKGGRFRATLSTVNYTAVSTEWQKVIVPLAEFGEQGSLWGRYREGDRKTHYRKMDWTRIDRFVWEIGETRSDEYEIYLDELLIVSEYDAAELNELKQAAADARYKSAGDGAGNLVLFDDRPNAGWFSANPNPYCRLVLDETTTKVGKKSFQYVMDPNSWSWAGFGIDFLDFNPFYKRGWLEFWVKGKNGEEKFSVGFLTINRQGLHVRSRLDVQRYVTVSAKWQRVKIPLVDFPMTGLHNHGLEEVKMPFNWDAINQFDVTAGPCQEREVAFWLDDVKVVAK